MQITLGNCSPFPKMGREGTLQTRRAEVFLLGNGADRVDVTLDIADNELAVATHATLQIHKVAGVADSSDALDDGLALPGEVLVLVASRFHGLLHLRQACDWLWGPPWTTLDRRAVGVVEVFVHPLERLFSLRHGLGGSSLFDGQRCFNRFAQFMLPMEESWGVMRPEVLFYIGQQSWSLIAGRLKKKGFKEERMTTIRLYDIGKSTTLESNKSLRSLVLRPSERHPLAVARAMANATSCCPTPRRRASRTTKTSSSSASSANIQAEYR
jgi:hypothetical protein